MTVTGSLWLVSFASALAISHDPLFKLHTWLSLIAGLGFLLGAVLTRRPEWLAEEEAPQRAAPAPPSSSR
jgi:hypothetical protein